MDYALPDLYDALYSFKDYEGEAARLTTLIRERNPRARSLLDVGCGTGKHLEQFRGAFDDVEGVDIHEGLLAIARQRLGSVPLYVGDMRTLDLGRRFDAVTCLFSAIGHAADVDELDEAIGAMAKHLQPGGILVVEPWLEPDAWVEGRLHLLTVDEPELKIARMTMAGRRGTKSILDFHYLVGTPDGFETSDEQMELALFTTREQLRAFERAGLQAEHDPDGLVDRGLLIGRAP